MNTLAVFRFALLCEAKYHDIVIGDADIRAVVDNDDIVKDQFGMVVISLDNDDIIHLCGWDGRDLSAPWLKVEAGSYILPDNDIGTILAGAQKFLDEKAIHARLI